LGKIFLGGKFSRKEGEKGGSNRGKGVFLNKASFFPGKGNPLPTVKKGKKSGRKPQQKKSAGHTANGGEGGNCRAVFKGKEFAGGSRRTEVNLMKKVERVKS